MLKASSPDDGLADLHLRQMAARGLSPLTISCRRNVLRRLGDYLGAPPMGASHGQLEAYLSFRRKGKGGRMLSPNTLRNELAHLRAYYAWLVKHDYRRDDPTDRIDPPRLVKPAVQPADDDTIADALGRADTDDAAMLALAAFAGLRAGEVAALDWADVDLRRSTITVRRGKGNKYRVVGASDAVKEALEALPHRHGVVIRRRDGRDGPNAPWQISKRASKLLGGRASGYTLHQLRHRFATAAYQGTHDLRAVQEALGHSSPTVTAIYAHTRTEQVQAAANAAGHLTLLPRAENDKGPPPPGLEGTGRTVGA